MKTEEEIKKEICRCYKEYNLNHTPPISLNSAGGISHYKRGLVLLWVLGYKTYREFFEDNPPEAEETNDQQRKYITSPLVYILGIKKAQLKAKEQELLEEFKRDLEQSINEMFQKTEAQ